MGNRRCFWCGITICWPRTLCRDCRPGFQDAGLYRQGGSPPFRKDARLGQKQTKGGPVLELEEADGGT